MSEAGGQSGRCVHVWLPVAVYERAFREALDRSAARGRRVTMSGLVREAVEARYSPRPKGVGRG
ncbi:MAG: hypothetical protein U0871_10925 [Gemmataceae bacterium]